MTASRNVAAGVVAPHGPEEHPAPPRPEGDRWRDRRLVSLAIRCVVFLVPVGAGVGAGVIASRVLPAGHGAARVAWWLAVLGVSVLASLLVEGVARRVLPLAWLMRLTLIFPDRAPSRFSIAMRSASVKRLRAWASTATAAADGDAERQAQQVLMLATALHAHDRRTRGHSERVRALTEIVAQEMRLPREDIQRLQWGGLLHDIGKIAVPSRILNKPGRPSDKEWSLLARHPEAGARIVGPLRAWLGGAADAVGQHHEHFDGTGYPDHLAGHDIALAARIVAVTDAFETMTAVRAYKRPMSAAAARAELAACAGTHFDPQVVRALMNASLGRLRWIAGFWAWLAHIPVVGLLPRTSAGLGTALGQRGVYAKTAAALAAVAVGAGLVDVSAIDGGGGGDLVASPDHPGAPRHDRDRALRPDGGAGPDGGAAPEAVRLSMEPIASVAPAGAAGGGASTGRAARGPDGGGSSSSEPFVGAAAQLGRLEVEVLPFPGAHQSSTTEVEVRADLGDLHIEAP